MGDIKTVFSSLHCFRSRERDKEDRQKWDQKSADRDNRRRNSSNIPPLIPPLRGAAPTTPQRPPPAYGDPRLDNRTPSNDPRNDNRVPSGGDLRGDNRIPSGYGDSDRWNQRDRYDFLEFFFSNKICDDCVL